MKISVVIATFNRRDALADCLRTLAAQDFSAEDFEVVVVVDGSTDGTAEMLRSMDIPAKLLFIEQDNTGQAGARNAGAERSSGEVILLLDDDLICEKDLLSAHWEAHEGAGVAVVSGEVRFESNPFADLDEQAFHKDLSGYYAQLKATGQPIWPKNAWVGPNCSMPRRLFLESGGFDATSFPRRWEDVELGIRLWKRGVPFRFAPQAAVEHRYVKPRHQSQADAKEDGASMVRLCRKHPEAREDSAIYHALDATRWKRMATRIVSGQWALRVAVLGGAIRVLKILAAGRRHAALADGCSDFSSSPSDSRAQGEKLVRGGS